MREITFAQALNESMADQMERDEKIFLIGEDIASGIFPVTDGLVERFGKDRVINAPISEAGFTGVALGAALMGMRPIVEIMFMDFITIAMDMIANQASKYAYMTGGQMHVPMVIRTKTGMGKRSGAQHSQNLAAWFMHIPGLKVAAPSTPLDAKGLLNTAIDDENPVLFIENRNLYNHKGPVPKKSFSIPLGEAEVKREGEDVTIVSSSYMSILSMMAAERLSQEGIDCEVIDLRSLVPYDELTIVDSVRKTGRLVTVDDGYERGGVGSEIVTAVMKKISRLKAPVATVASPNVPVPCSPRLEDTYMVNEEKIVDRIRHMMET
jgi:pyruvate dehydrogenase E1 component beta subunit